MTLEIFLRYLHFLSILVIAATLSMELVLLKPRLTRAALRRLSLIDALYGVAAATLLTAGLIMWLKGVTKPEMYYTKNWIFLTKVGLFALIGILSIYPTIFFLRKRQGVAEEEVKVPGMIFWMLRAELALLAIIPILATLMSRGMGYFGS